MKLVSVFRFGVSVRRSCPFICERLILSIRTVKCVKLSSIRPWRTKALDCELPWHTPYRPNLRGNNLTASLFNCIRVATCLNQTTPSNVNDKWKEIRSVPFNIGYYSRIRLGWRKKWKITAKKVARLRPAIQYSNSPVLHENYLHC
jgi:hypothetical protein